MLDVKKLLTKIMGKLPTIVVDTKQVTGVNIAANNVAESSVSAAKTGFTAIAVVGFMTSGSGVSYLIPYHLYVDNNTVYYAFRNNNNSARSNLTFTFYVLYIKWGGVVSRLLYSLINVRGCYAC